MPAPPANRKFPRRPPGGASLLGKKPKARPSYTVDDAMADTRGRATPIDGKAFGTDKGFGVYRGKFGKLTYKGTGKAQAAPQKPNPAPGKGNPSGSGESATAGPQSQAMKDISGYYLGLADLLKGIGPGIGTAYSDAASQIAGFGQGFSGDFRDRMTANADDTQNSIERITGNYLSDATEAKARGGYDIGAAADVGYGLGAYLPAKSLSEQGAAFQAAAGFLPAAAGQQGLYALNAQARAEAEAAAKSGGAAGEAKASASLSKALGYLVDTYGKPILNGKGKPIPIPKEGLTPYQQAQLEIAQQRESRYIDNENFDRWKATQDITFRSAKEERAVRAAMAKGKTIDSSASRTRGFIVYKDGSVPKGANGKPIPIADSAGKTSKTKAKQNYQSAVAAARTLKGEPLPAESVGDGWYLAQPGLGTTKQGFDGSSVYVTRDPRKAKTDGYNWAQAVKYLKERYGITQATAVRALKSSGWIKPPVVKKTTKVPRPNMEMASLPQLKRYAKSIGINPVALANMDRDTLLKTIEYAERNGV